MRLAIVLGVVLAAGSARAAPPTEGPDAAPVTIVGWSDFSCEQCAHVQPKLAALAKRYPAKIRWVHRAFPLDHDNLLAAEASYAAAAQGRYKAMSEALYKVRGYVDRAKVEKMAHKLGLDMKRFRADLDAQRFRIEIEADLAEAYHRGVRGAPTFFVNGHRLAGNQPLDVFVHAVDEALAAR